MQRDCMLCLRQTLNDAKGAKACWELNFKAETCSCLIKMFIKMRITYVSSAGCMLDFVLF